MKIRWKPRYVGLSRFCFYPTSCQNSFMASKVLDFLWDFDLIYSPHFTILSVFLILLFYLSIFLPPISFIRSFVHLISSHSFILLSFLPVFLPFFFLSFPYAVHYMFTESYSITLSQYHWLHESCIVVWQLGSALLQCP